MDWELLLRIPPPLIVIWTKFVPSKLASTTTFPDPDPETCKASCAQIGVVKDNVAPGPTVVTPVVV